MKTLKQLKKTLEDPKKGTTGVDAYYPKGEDEQRFVDKHKIEKTEDANGNDDEVFKGTKVKKIERASERHGYDQPQDQHVHEDVEQVDEMSKEEMSKREDIVKGMKKRLGDFKSRYGKDAKNVMYATANKMAQTDEQVEVKEEDLDITLLEMFASLDEESKDMLIEMIEEGLEDQILQMLEEEAQD